LEEPGIDGRIENRVGLCGMDPYGLEQAPVADCCEYDDKFSVAMNVRIFVK
jgi:hypothetical protein